jgi:transposase InsO family protein
MYGSAYSQSPVWGTHPNFPTSPLDVIPTPVESPELKTITLAGVEVGEDDDAETTSSLPDSQMEKSSKDLAVELEKRGKKSPSSAEKKLSLIASAHAMGHFGVEATFRKLFHEGWWWPQMRSEISDQLKECDACTRFTVVKTGYHPAQAITAVGPWDHVQIDTSVHLPESPDGYTALLVVICVFSSFVVLRPLKNTQAQCVAEALWSIFCILGLPKIMQSDNGPEFSNDILRVLIKLSGIEHRFISPYHPQADGKVERSIGTTTMIIKKMLHGTTHHWPLFVNFAQLSFNQKISSLTGSAPFSLMFGRRCNEIRSYSSESDEYTLINLDDWKEHQEKILSLIYPAISERIKGGKDKMIQSLNRSRKILLPYSLPEGSTVMLKDPVRANKFEPKYIGPYTIIRRARNGAYVLKDATGMILDRHVPLDQMKIVVKGSRRRKIDESLETFEVESILSHRGDPGAYEYFVHWKGYSADEDSWLSATRFQDTKIIEEYWRRTLGASR